MALLARKISGAFEKRAQDPFSPEIFAAEPRNAGIQHFQIQSFVTQTNAPFTPKLKHV